MRCIMFLGWLNAREAVQAASALADAFPSSTPASAVVKEFLQRASYELRSRKLNFYKRVRFANAFRWRLVEKGVRAEVAAELTQTLLIASSTPPTLATKTT